MIPLGDMLQFIKVQGRVIRGICQAVILVLVFSLAACASPTAEQITHSPHPPTAQSSTPTRSSPTPSVTPSKTLSPTLTSTTTPTPGPIFCSPLADISIGELPEILKNPFDEPLPGHDDGHHGADFAYYSRGEHKVMLGLPVKSVLAGRVAAVILDKPPYGNAIIIETSLQSLGTAGAPLANLLPTPAPTIQPDPRLTCPLLDPLPAWPAEKTSLYLLYAHLQFAPSHQVGDAVACGEQIGQVGTTGSSVNPHLHLEARIGPPGVTFSSLGHYGAVSRLEMANYCLWRASQWFQMFNPLLLFQ